MFKLSYLMSNDMSPSCKIRPHHRRGIEWSHGKLHQLISLSVDELAEAVFLRLTTRSRRILKTRLRFALIAGSEVGVTAIPSSCSTTRALEEEEVEDEMEEGGGGGRKGER